MLPPAVIDEPTVPSASAGGRWSSRRRLIALLVVSALAVAGVAAVEIMRSEGRPGPPPGSWTVVPHRGLGAWVDVYDWTQEFGGRSPSVDVADIEVMAEAGVQTLYLQTSHRRSHEDVIEPERLNALIDEAHAHDMHVVAWYLPTFVNLERDLRRLIAASELAVDGLAVDIEAIDVPDPVERNRRVLDLSARLRAAVGNDRTLAAITMSSVHLQVVNPDYWPDYPWAELATTYDVILPMAYWTLRRDDLREGLRYVGENIDRIRAATGREDLLIHVIGGIADEATVTDVEGMLSAIEDRGAIGGSLYDWNTSTEEQWAVLRPLRDLRTTPE